MKKIEHIKHNYFQLDIKVRALFWFVFCNFFQKGLTFLCVPLYTRMLSSYQYGLYSIYQSYTSIVMVFLTLNLFYSGYAAGLTHFSNDERQYTTSCIGFTLCLSLICGSILVILKYSFADDYLFPSRYLIYMIIEIMFTSVFNFWSARERYRYHYRELLLITLLSSIICEFLGVISINIIPKQYRLDMRILIGIIHWGVLGIYGLKKFYIKEYSFFSKKYWLYSARNNIPLIPHYLSGVILNQSDKIMIERIENANATAYYSLAHSIAMMTILITSALKNVCDPIIYQSIKKNNGENYERFIHTLFSFVSILVFIASLVAPEILLVFGPKEYQNARYVLPALAVSVFFIFSYNIFSTVFFYYRKSKLMMGISFLIACLNLLLNYLLIPRWGYIVAGYTTMISYIVFAITYCVMSSRLLVYNQKKMFWNKKKYYMIAGITVLNSNLVILFYDRLFFRLIILLTVFILCILQRKKFLYMFKGVNKGEI